MSYRIAYVRFTQEGQVYPVNCDRADLSPKDTVVVKMPAKRELKLAEVDRVEFLNWRCTNTILCKKSEFHLDGHGGYRIQRLSEHDVIETLEELESELVLMDWTPMSLSRHVYMVVFVKKLESHAAAIGVRRNGIDFQFYEGGWCGAALTRFPDGPTKLVRHYFHKSEVDLLQFCKEFAANAHRPFLELASYFRPVGHKQTRATSPRDELREIRWAIGEAMSDTERDAFS